MCSGSVVRRLRILLLRFAVFLLLLLFVLVVILGLIWVLSS